MTENDNVFLQIIERMRISDHLSISEAENLRLNYLDYVNDIAQKNAAMVSPQPAAPQPLVTEKGNVFLQIIEKMKNSEYLSVGEAEDLRLNYFDYVNDLSQKNAALAPPQPTASQSAVPQPVTSQSAARANEFQNMPAYTASPVLSTPSKNSIRERNLSWILNTGVALILISGAIFGTTTWGILGGFGRVALLVCVTLLFFGVSVFAARALRLRKTANAFWFLGSLMLAVLLLSIGFFRLFGDYFSCFGDGRYLFGLFSCCVCLPEFIYSTYKFKSRIFSWLSLIDMSLGFSFFAASFQLKAPAFYLLLLLFSGALIVAKRLLKDMTALQLFLREAWLFIQLNLIVTSLFVVFSYSTAYLYPLSIIAAALLFFVLSECEGLFGYDYVSALLFDLGLFMLALDFQNAGVQYLIVAAAGIALTCVAVAMRGNQAKSLRYTVISGVSALVAFLYIVIFMTNYWQNGTGMIVALLALCVILADIIYLGIRFKNPFLGALVPPLAVITVYYSSAVIESYWSNPFDKAYLLVMTVLLFAVLYLFNHKKIYRATGISSAITTVLNLTILFFMCISPKPFLISLPIIGLVLTAVLFMIYRKCDSDDLKQFIKYCIPVTLILSICLLRYAYSMYAIPALPFYFYAAFAGFVLSFGALGWFKDLKKPMYYALQIIMAFVFVLVQFELFTPFSNNMNFIGGNALFFTSVFALTAGCAIFCLQSASHRVERNLLLHTALFVMTMYVVWIDRFIAVNFSIDLGRYIFYAAGFLTLLCYAFIKSRDLRRQICYYSCAIAVILLFGGLFAGSMMWYEYIVALTFAALLCLEMISCELDLFVLLPMLLLLSANHIFFTKILVGSVGCLLPAFMWCAILMFVGQRNYQLIFTKKKIDWFSPAALLTILFLPYHYSDVALPHLSVIVPGCLAAVWFFTNRKRLFHGSAKCGGTLFVVSLVFPYYHLIASFVLPNAVSFEVVLLPIVVLCTAILKWIFKDSKNGFTKTMEYLIPSLCYLILLIHLIVSDSLAEAIIIISFGIASLLYGSFLKTRSSLIMGGAVILVGAVLKTKTFWLSMQWWFYLLVAGVILVSIAGVNEYSKNKNGGALSQRAGKWIEKFRDWD